MMPRRTTSTRSIGGLLAAVCLALGACASDKTTDPDPPATACETDTTPIEFTAPGFPPMVVPEDNPTTPAGVALGRRLFYDPVLSDDGTLSCGGCHLPSHAFADSASLSQGITGETGSRNAPALMNVGWFRELFWDGRAGSLEEQIDGPVTHPKEMAADWDEVVARVAASDGYLDCFEATFGDRQITADRIKKAIAQFERSFVSANAPYDRWQIGAGELSPAAVRGWQIFFSEVGDCFHCHGVNGLFTDNRYHNVGVDSVIVDPGLGGITERPEHVGLFKTPSLRNVERTAPYMHDGRFQTLREVVEHYNHGGFRTATVDPLIRVGVGLQLSEQQVSDLVEFLRALTDDDFFTNPDYQDPSARASD